MCTLVGTLDGHKDSINATQFSPNGAYLASGGEDGLLLIHSINNWRPLLRFVDASPITSLMFKSQQDVRISLNETQDKIHCMAHHRRKNLLAVGCGQDVFMINYEIRGEGKSSWVVTSKTSFLPPPRPPGSSGFLSNPLARSISFLKADCLLIAYLDHGIVWLLGPEDFSSHLAYHAKGMSNVRLVPRASYAVNAEIYHRGRAAVSPNESKLAVTNLFDGVDVYSMADQSRLNSVSVDVKENVSTAVAFLSDNTVVFGGGSGVAYIAEGTPLMVTRILRHGGILYALLGQMPHSNGDV
ncbi:WD40-repeat-containing domain protein [Thelephora terrestris]|uniref:WD40-repeat-containing domain protein n=1 Tax=Thelephora terrestris TaxID=56493 RepID=A0A9P6HP72_9AGAM|nr:WD40-repeat-containing domain protein [Thelephora terrestris]